MTFASPTDVVHADRGTMLVFGQSGNNNPQFAFWDGDTWDDERSASSIGDDAAYIVVRSCPTRSEMAMGTLDGNKSVEVQFHDGGSWGSVTEVCGDVDYTDQRPFDIAYEQLSGDLLIAYWDKDQSTVRSRTYDGTTISGETSLSIPKSRWLALYPEPESDNIMLVALLDGKDIEVALWNGNAWGTVYSHENDTGYNTEDCFDFAWEGLSGDGLLTYAENGEVQPRYRTWNGSSWSAELTLPSVGKKQHYHRLAVDPVSDQILFASLDDDKHLNANVWSGSTWGTNQELNTDIKDKDAPLFDLTFVGGGGSAIIGYYVDGTDRLTYRTWNGSNWSGESTGPDVGDDIRVVSTAPGVKSGEALCLVSDGGNDLIALYWDGSTMTSQQVEGDLPDSTKPCFMIASNLGQGTALMVVPDPLSVAAEDVARRTYFQAWGWVVPYIDEANSQASFDAAIATSDVVYVPENVNSATLGTKLTDAASGVVVEESDCFDEFDFTEANAGSRSGTQVDVQASSHFITANLSPGIVTIVTSAQSMNEVTEPARRGAQVLAEWPSGSSLALTAIDWCADHNGRRVFLPIGDTAFNWSALNGTGLDIVDRSLQWSAALVARWKLDETIGQIAADASTHGNDATLGGAFSFPTSTTSGRVEDALTFNGSTDYATMADLQLADGPFTVSAWIRTSDLSSANPTWGMGIVRSTTGESIGDFFLAVDDGGAVHFGNWRSSGNDADGVTYTADDAVVTGGWHHIVATWDGTTNKIFVNGDDQATSTEATSTGWGTEHSIGRNRIGGAYHFFGTIDDVRIYNRAVSADEAEMMFRACGYRIVGWQEIDPN